MHVINLLWVLMLAFHHLMAVMCCVVIDRCKLMNVTVVLNSDALTPVVNKEDLLITLVITLSLT